MKSLRTYSLDMECIEFLESKGNKSAYLNELILNEMGSARQADVLSSMTVEQLKILQDKNKEIKAKKAQLELEEKELENTLNGY